MKDGLGFVSMKERLHALGGQINVYSKPLRGTRIEVSVPLKLENDSPDKSRHAEMNFELIQGREKL
jgi:signal transduction histidine kinase